jgi:hypothetical protein
VTDDVDRRPSMKQIVDRLTSIRYQDAEGEVAPSVQDSVKSLTQDVAENVGLDWGVSGQSD